MSTNPSITETRPYRVADERYAPPEPPARSGWVTFAGIMFLISSFTNFFWGLAALDTKGYLDEGGLLYSSLETWGWVAIGWSLLVAVGAVMLLAGTRSGPVVGIVLASISAVFWLFALPVMPLFAMTALLIDAMVIYGLATYGTIQNR